MRRSLRFLAAPALALALVLTSCDDARSPMPGSITGPVPDSTIDANGEQLLGSLLGGLLGGSDDVSTVTDASGREYTLVRGRIPDIIPDLRLSKLIGPEGGLLSLAGHKLIVPEGAVDQLTLFTLTLVSDGHVEIEVTALLRTLFGVLNIGSHGFDEPVELSLTYAWASNVEDARDLVVLRMPSYGHSGTYERMPSTVDLQRKVVVAQLDHFSRYCLAY